jgi:hypothetical protein
MKASFVAVLCLACASVSLPVRAQSPGVPIYAEGKGARPLGALSKSAKKLRESGALLSFERAKEQYKRTSCQLTLPQPSTQKLEPRQIWQRARAAHMRIGWLYLCNDCEHWHLGLSGGYAVTSDAVATCSHVIDPLDEMRQGYLIAADDDDNLFPITEVLAVNRSLDTAIVKLKGANLTPLPLGQEVHPGDTIYCFSDPVDRRGFFSQGMVNRFVKRPFLTEKDLHDEDRKSIRASASRTKPAAENPVWLEVSAEWAPGSSGSAVLDVCGNAVGHVSEVESVLEDPDPGARHAARATMIIFHDAIAAGNVLSLIKPVPVPLAPQPATPLAAK